MSAACAGAGPGRLIAFRQILPRSGLSCRDLLDLEHWDSGGRRWQVVEGSCNPELGRYVVIHAGNTAWASWGIGRDGGALLLWDCVSHADIGRFASMQAALAALSGAAASRPVRAAVVRFHPEAAPGGRGRADATLAGRDLHQ